MERIELVDPIPREVDGSNIRSQIPGLLRKFMDNDPWRVPSAEQPRRENNKSKEKSTAES